MDYFYYVEVTYRDGSKEAKYFDYIREAISFLNVRLIQKRDTLIDAELQRKEKK